MILNVFTKLGVDQTIFYQFAIVVVLYFILKNLFFNKLKEVIVLREDKTTKLEGQANAKLQQSQKMADNYKSKMDKIYLESQEKFRERKSKLAHEEKEKLDHFEDKLQNDYETQMHKLSDEMKVKKADAFKKTEELSHSLVNKLIQ